MNYKKGDIVQYIPCNELFTRAPTFEPGSILLITEITTYADISVQLLFGRKLQHGVDGIMEANLQPYTHKEETQ